TESSIGLRAVPRASDGPAPRTPGVVRRYPLGDLLSPDGSAAPPPESTRAAAEKEGLLPLESWILERLPRAFPGVTRLAFVRTTRARYGRSRESESTATELEVESSDSARPEPIEKFIDGLVLQGRRPVTIDAWIFERRPGDAAGGPANAEIL